MRQFDARTADELWTAAVSAFHPPSNGASDDLSLREQPSRGGPTRELLHVSFFLREPRQRWVFNRRPPLNPAFALAEVLWILAGRQDAAFLTAWNSQLPKFCGDGPTLHGAYGYRLRKSFGFDQLVAACETLRANPNSRQAVLSIWDPTRDLPTEGGAPQSEDIPCNIVAFLRVRDERLEWTQVMRSNDLFLGFPHNIVQFTSLQEIMAGWLGLEVGGYYHLSDSLHVYARDAQHIEQSVPGSGAENTDDLRLPREQFDKVLDQVVQSADFLRRDTLRAGQASALVADSRELPSAYLNLLRVLAAEAARRRSWLDESAAIASECTNPAFKLLWSRWWARVQREPGTQTQPLPQSIPS